MNGPKRWLGAVRTNGKNFNREDCKEIARGTNEALKFYRLEEHGEMAEQSRECGEGSGADDALAAVGLGAGIRDVIALAIERDDEHGTAVELAARLVGGDLRGLVALGVDVSDPFAEGATTEFFSAAEEVDGVVRAIGSEEELHGAEMLVAKREKVHPHAKASVAFGSCQDPVSSCHHSVASGQ
jgi:hypothetical protein